MRRHARFLAAFSVGLMAALGAGLGGLSGGMRVLLAVDLFYVTYLVLMLPLTRMTPAALRKRAASADEGTQLIIVLAFFAVAIGLAALVSILGRNGTRTSFEVGLALASVPLGWAMIHTLAAFHYAHMFYGQGADNADRGGMNFPGGAEPGIWDFLYVAFGIGMTAQVADVAVTDSGLRRAVLLHSVVSFFLNTVILALAVNAAVNLST